VTLCHKWLGNPSKSKEGKGKEWERRAIESLVLEGGPRGKVGEEGWKVWCLKVGGQEGKLVQKYLAL
jgi:hypothetical protein